MTVREQLLQRYPTMAEKAKTNRAAAIYLHCRECVGGNINDVKECGMESCFLYPFRLKSEAPKIKRTFSEETKQKMKERLAKARERKENK